MKSHEKGAVLVTGAAGFIAYHTIEALLKQGTDVVGVDNFDPFYPRHHKEKNLEDLKQLSRKIGTPFPFYEMDILEIPLKLFEKHSIGAVVHLAAKAGVRPSLVDPQAYARVNILGTLHLLELCRASRIDRFVFGSSSSVYGNDTSVPFVEEAPAVDPISPYAATKRSAELLCKTFAHLYACRIAMLRFFTVYGPRQRPDLAIYKFTDLMTNQKPIDLYGDGNTSRDYTYATDIASGILAALNWTHTAKPGQCEAFNLGNSYPITLLSLVKLIESKVGKKAQIRWKPMQPGDVERTFADLSKSKRLLGYQPHTTLEQGIKSFVDWFEKARRSPSAPEPQLVASNL